MIVYIQIDKAHLVDPCEVADDDDDVPLIE